MTTTQPPLTYTICFDWVVRATGDSATALAYGVIWRYAQMRNDRCYASCESLASDLAWTRQRIMRHIRHLLDQGLILCANPTAMGVPREYVPVTYEQWIAAHPSAEGPPQSPPEKRDIPWGPLGGGHVPTPPEGPPPSPPERQPIPWGPLGGCHVISTHDTPYVTTSYSLVIQHDPLCVTTSHLPVSPHDIPSAKPPNPPVDQQDTPCPASSPPVVAPQANPCPAPAQPRVVTRDTRNTIQDTKDTKEIPEREAPSARRKALPKTSRPAASKAASAAPRAPGPQLIKTITGRMPPQATHPRILRVLGQEPSVERLRACYEEWCARGYNPRNLTWLFEWYAAGVIPPNRPPARAGRSTPHADPASLPGEFARWHEYQQAVQQGEKPDDAKRRLGL